MTKKGFTLLELLIVISILATLSAILVLILNPVEYLRRARDSQRLKDYALINQAVNYYSYNSSVKGGDIDLDGPNFSASCKNQANQRIFVSVPNDNGETSPTPPPSGWSYVRATSTVLRDVNGSGWLPIDFSNSNGGVQPLNVLPVDPINTFDSGFFYTYTCGSYELNMKFESEKYQELAQDDGGNESDIYELGDNLDTAPVQPIYHQTAGASAPTLTLTASPTTITSGNSASLTWSTTNATSCTVPSPGAAGWVVGSKATSGSESVSPTANGTYSLDCTGPGGNVSQSASVTVNPLPPGIVTLYPSADSANTLYRAWTGTFADVDEVGANDGLTTKVFTSAVDAVEAFVMNTAETQLGAPTQVKLIVWAKDTNINPAEALQIHPRLRFNSTNDDSKTVQSLTNTFTKYEWIYTASPDGSAWTWNKIINGTLGNLEAGVIFKNPNAYSGEAQVTQIYLEVSYQ